MLGASSDCAGISAAAPTFGGYPYISVDSSVVSTWTLPDLFCDTQLVSFASCPTCCRHHARCGKYNVHEVCLTGTLQTLFLWYLNLYSCGTLTSIPIPRATSLMMLPLSQGKLLVTLIPATEPFVTASDLCGRTAWGHISWTNTTGWTALARYPGYSNALSVVDVRIVKALNRNLLFVSSQNSLPCSPEGFTMGTF